MSLDEGSLASNPRPHGRFLFAQSGASGKLAAELSHADDPHGRELLLVDSVADSWHASFSRFGETVVTFTMTDA
ncbi:hypothetical protein ABZ400_33155 [Streptomyces sp. NPDC005897]|uniref:hypothetical protein n=1 Tax=Streptomyces sp. NPDC005897 TaxID=3157081 RepID=UPI0033D52C3E